MKIIVPMSGAGRRFIEEGYTDPKPLISIAGKRMIQYVVEMYPGSRKDFIFICHNVHLQNSEMQKILAELTPDAKIIGIDKTVWNGPVPDILKIQDIIPDNEEIIVSYCDFSMVWDFEDFKHVVAEKRYEGAIIAYKGFHPHHFGATYYGYMRVDEKKILLEIKEKESFTQNRTEEYASAGSYYFRTGALMKKYFQEAVDIGMRTRYEFFASVPYNLMVRDELTVFVYEVSKFIQLGAPHDVRTFEYWADYFRKYDIP